MTPLLLLDSLVYFLRDNFAGYQLVNKKGDLQQIKIYPQYVPQPAAITINNRATGLKNYSELDYDANFPCIVVRIVDITDKEEGKPDQSRANVKIITGIYDANPECQGYRDIMNIQDKIRDLLLTNRILIKKFMLDMPLITKILDADTWPVYFGEMNLVYNIGRPQQPDYYYHHHKGGY